MNEIFRDVRFALRQLRKTPGFTLTVVATLALGIGALVTVATWTNAVLLNPWPAVRAAQQVRALREDIAALNGRLAAALDALGIDDKLPAEMRVVK